MLHFKPRVSFDENTQSQTHSHNENKLLPLLPKPLKQKQVSTPKVEHANEDWETAIDESYELGEFVDAELGSQWLEREEERNPTTQAQLERVIERGRSISARRFREVYYVDRPRPLARK